MKYIVILIAGILVTGAAQAATAKLNSEKALSRWTTYYYLHPDPAQFTEAVDFMASSGLLVDDHARRAIVGFIAGVVRNNPNKLNGWTEHFKSLNDNQLSTIALGIWYADLPKSKEVVDSFIENRSGVRKRLGFLLSQSTMQLTSIPLSKGAWVLDANWGYFMATGLESPVIRIISALKWMNEKGNVKELLMAGAARWSLTSNAVQHKRVLEICESQISKQPQQIAAILKQIVTKARKDLESMPNKSPNLTAPGGAAGWLRR